jgi:hypothetical protein
MLQPLLDVGSLACAIASVGLLLAAWLAKSDANAGVEGRAIAHGKRSYFLHLAAIFAWVLAALVATRLALVVRTQADASTWDGGLAVGFIAACAAAILALFLGLRRGGRDGWSRTQFLTIGAARDARLELALLALQTHWDASTLSSDEARRVEYDEVKEAVARLRGAKAADKTDDDWRRHLQ